MDIRQHVCWKAIGNDQGKLEFCGLPEVTADTVAKPLKPQTLITGKEMFSMMASFNETVKKQIDISKRRGIERST